MRTERPTCRECACNKVCEYFENENSRNLDETCPLCNWENYFVPKQEWISVEDRLPEVGTMVVGYDYESNVRCYFITEERWWIDDGWNTAKGWGITHWMPLPPPPKENKND